jgi:hypothetical protein
VQAFRLVPEFRGGASLPDEHPLPISITVQSAVGVFVVGNDDGYMPADLPWLTTTGASGSSCILFGDDSSSPLLRIPDLPLDDELAESLALLCDFLVVIVIPTDDDDDNGDQKLKQLLPSLIKGANRRRLLSTTCPTLVKGKLIIVSPSANDPRWCETLIGEVKTTTTAWQSVDTVTMEGLKDHWKNIHLDDSSSSSSSTVSTLLPDENNALPFVKLLQQVYQSSSQKAPPANDFTLQPISKKQPEVVGTEIKTQRDSVANMEYKHSSSRQDPPPNDVMLQPISEKQPEVVRTEIKTQRDSVANMEYNALIQEVLTTAQIGLEALESKMEEVMLGDQANQMPLLDFGSLANAILNQAYQQLEGIPSDVRLVVLERMTVELHRLYKDQLQALRDYYGRRYETTLEAHEDDEGEWASAAEYATQGFQAAAQHAVPTLCQAGGELAAFASDFGFVDVLQGLIKDMMEATQLRKDEQSLALDDDEDDDDLSRKSRRVPKWLEKLAARVFVLGVNYIQGWLAWQGVKRAALERDRNMPKFPLF